jgi:uncharacterized protein YjbI with pentapeptide repeats
MLVVETLEILLLSIHLIKDVGGQMGRAIAASRQLRSYLKETCSDPDVAFHNKYSTLPIPCKDVDGVPHRNLLLTLLDKLQGNDMDWTLLLGEIGAGKTATLSLLYVEIAKLFLARKLKAIPIFIRLRDNWDPKDVEGSLRRHVDSDILHRLMKSNVRLVLLLDGLDEFAMQYGRPLSLRQISENVLHHPFLKKCIVIVSTRPNVISNLQDLSAYRDVFPDQYQLLDLQEVDVADYVRSHGLAQTFESLNREVRRLLSKPLFLYFFVTASQGAAGLGHRPVRFTDEVQLYNWFFAEWYSRALTQMGLENPLPDMDVLRRFLELIAVESASSPTGALSEEQIRRLSARLVNENPHLGLFINGVFGQVKERWLLVPRLEGNSKQYRFIHPSLADYFLSGPVAQSYLNNEPGGGLRPSHFGELTLLFVKAHLNREGNLGQILRTKIASLKDAADRLSSIDGAVSVVLWLEQGAEALNLNGDQQTWLQKEWKRLEAQPGGGGAVAIRGALRRVRLPKASLTDLVLQSYDLSQNSDLSGATLRDCTFVGGEPPFKLSSVKLDGAVLRNCIFTDVQLNDASLTGATFENCHFKSCHLQRAKVADSQFNGCRFSSKCDLTSADFSRAVFCDGVFEDCTIVGATMDNCVSQGLRMRRCDLYQMSVTSFPRPHLEDCSNVPPQW